MSIINSVFNVLRFNRKNWRAVVLCIFAATVFWFFNALNKSYTANIRFPLAFDYQQEGYIPVRPLPEDIRINVTGIGWNLFRRSIGIKVPPLVIPLERPSEVRKIVGSTLPALFANQLEGFEINFVLTDTLYVAIEPRTKRWITLKLDSPSILFRNGYGMASGATLKPDSIYIEGPIRLVNDLAEPHYLKLVQRNIDENFNDDVEVKFLNDELIRRNPPTVNVTFQVDPLITRTDSLFLTVINAPKKSRPVIGNKTVVCTFTYPERVASQYARDSVRAVLDLKNYSGGEKKILPLITGLPPYSKIVHNDSIRVKM